MTARKDLTRWNRAGLARFRYIDGNAAEYLETIRLRLHKSFHDPDSHLCEWLSPKEEIPVEELEAVEESALQRQQRLAVRQGRILEMYHQDRRDWAWEISRTFSRACQILTEHADAYANESYLNTATQWEHVRRLVEMLDYHPAPPASAYTRLVLTTKENKTGTVKKGFKVQHTPESGAKIVFETLEDTDIDSDLNELRPKGWNKSTDPAVKLPTVKGAGNKFSILAGKDAIVLQKIGEEWFSQLNTIPNKNPFKIYHFLDLDPKNPGIVLPHDHTPVIGETRLREFKAIATEICLYELKDGWKELMEKTLQPSFNS